MPRGGARPGAGRPRGGRTGPTTKRYADLKAAIRDDIVPVNGLLRLASVYQKLALSGKDKGAAEIYRRALKDAAPYLHPKLAAIEHTGKLSLQDVLERLTPDQLAAFADALAAASAEAGDEPATEQPSGMAAGPGEPPATGSVH